MKRIIKGAEPAELAEWKSDNALVPENMHYGSLHGEQTTAIRKQMLAEQGYICAYTMIRLTDEHHCHLEHVISQDQDPRRDLDYANMLACFPGRRKDSESADTLTRSSEFFGAKFKDNTPVDDTNFVSPCTPDVESKFLYRLSGTIEAVDGDPAAISTISILGLQHEALQEIRRSTFEAVGISRFIKSPISANEARELSQSILAKDAHGRFPAYCLAIAHAALEYAELEETATRS